MYCLPFSEVRLGARRVTGRGSFYIHVGCSDIIQKLKRPISPTYIAYITKLHIWRREEGEAKSELWKELSIGVLWLQVYHRRWQGWTVRALVYIKPGHRGGPLPKALTLTVTGTYGEKNSGQSDSWAWVLCIWRSREPRLPRSCHPVLTLVCKFLLAARNFWNSRGEKNAAN